MHTSGRRFTRATISTTVLLGAALVHAGACAALDARAALTVRHLAVGSPAPTTVFQDSMQDLDATGSLAEAGFAPDLLHVDPSTSARLGYGVITGNVHADSAHPGDGIHYTFDATGSGRFTDQFTVSSNGLTGAGTLTLRATVQAAFAFDPQGTPGATDFLAVGATWLDLYADNIARVQDRYTTIYQADISENIQARLKIEVDSLNGSFELVQSDPQLAGAGYVVHQHFVVDAVPFQFGVPVNLNVYMNVIGSAQACCAQGVGIDAVSGAWFRWDGISDVVRSDGSLVSNFQALGAATGFNYAQAAVVPEPGTAWMMLVGLLPSLGTWCRRLRHQRQRLSGTASTQ